MSFDRSDELLVVGDLAVDSDRGFLTVPLPLLYYSREPVPFFVLEGEVLSPTLAFGEFLELIDATGRMKVSFMCRVGKGERLGHTLL